MIPAQMEGVRSIADPAVVVGSRIMKRAKSSGSAAVGAESGIAVAREAVKVAT